MEQYWSQQKLFFIATCILFPERITSAPLSVSQMDTYIKHLFDGNEQLEVLNKYASKKMLEVAACLDSNGESQYLITNIDQGKFKTELTNYLEKFRNDELLASPSVKPGLFDELQSCLRQYLLHSNRSMPVVNPFNIWPNWIEGYGKIYPFWEIILSSSEIKPKNTRIHNIGYSLSIDNDLPVPFAEVEITNPALSKQLRSIELQPSETYADSTPEVTKKSSLDLGSISLKPESYDKYKGILHLAPYSVRAIAGKTGVKRPKDGKKSGQRYMQCWVMERLFRSVNTLNKGVEISAILGVNKIILDKKMKKKVENAKTEINNKVAKDNGPKNLLIIDGTKIKVDKSYL